MPRDHLLGWSAAANMIADSMPVAKKYHAKQLVRVPMPANSKALDVIPSQAPDLETQSADWPEPQNELVRGRVYKVKSIGDSFYFSRWEDVWMMTWSSKSGASSTQMTSIFQDWRAIE